MNYYYYPLCSKDFTFENIFSTESISPPDFYPLREFGMDFFYAIPHLHNNSAIVLYSNPPKFPEEIANDYIRFVLKIDSTALDIEEIIAISEGIIGYRKTIYLTISNFEILFFSDKEKKVAQMKSESSLTTKGLMKFDDNFKIIQEIDCLNFDLGEISKIKEDEDCRKTNIEIDLKYNQYKGLLYGISSGLLRIKTKEEIQVKKALQEIIDLFASLKNNVENSQSKSQYKTNLKDVGIVRSALDLRSKLFDLIEATEILLIETLRIKKFSENDLEIFIRDKYKELGFTIEEIKTYIKFKKLDEELLGMDSFSKLKNSYLKANSHNNPTAHFSMLKDQIKTYISTNGQISDYAKSTREKANDAFKQSISLLNRFVDQSFAKATPSPILDLSGISYHKTDHKIELRPGFCDISEITRKEYILTINSILRHGKRGKGEVKLDQILAIVDEVAANLSTQKPGKSSLLYQYLNNEIPSYDIERAHSLVMKNFVAFVFNPNSIEKLGSFLEAKRIESQWMAFSFWCAFNGFASTSKFFISSFFDGDNKGAADYMDSFLRNFFIDNKSENVKITGPVTTPQGLFGIPGDDISITASKFFELHLKEKKKISLDEFNYIATLGDKEKMINYLRDRLRFTKKEATRIIDQYTEFINNPALF